MLLAALGAVYAYFALRGPESFGTAATLQLIARQTAIVGVAALGMTLIIAAGGIDLSVGSVVALTTVAVAAFLQLGWSEAWAAAAGVGVGMLCGLVNGLLITRVRVVPFIATLGTLLIFRGAAKALAKEQKIDVDAEMTWIDGLLATLPRSQKWMLVPPGVWGLLALAVAAFVVLRKTVFGRRMIAIGSNEKAARLCGVPVERVQVGIYTLAGLFVGAAGVLQFSRLTVGDPTVALGMELDVIAAVVIGGGSLAGGRASVIGTLLGAFLMSTIRAGGQQMGWHNWQQEIITGAIIVAAVALDRFRHRAG